MAHRRLDPPRAEPWFNRLRLTNVRCFEETVVPLDRRVTVIIGENGAGKTTIAETLASLSFGEDEGLKEFPSRHEHVFGPGGQRYVLLGLSGHRSLPDDVENDPAILRRLPPRFH